MIVSKTMGFCAAHHLPNYIGPCHEVHGHTWSVKVSLKGKVDYDSGMVLDFKFVSQYLKDILNRFDHGDANDVVYNPTAENIAVYVWKKMCYALFGRDNITGNQFYSMHSVTVWESPDSEAVYDGK